MYAGAFRLVNFFPEVWDIVASLTIHLEMQRFVPFVSEFGLTRCQIQESSPAIVFFVREIAIFRLLNPFILIC